MDVRITKLRVALAALFVLAGVGLASLLSPLIGTALATVGTVSNISDHSASAYFAKVTSSGELKTNGVVSGGSISIAAPKTPFSFPAFSGEGGSANVQFPATNATLAFTGFRIANGTSASTTVSIFQYGTATTTCSEGPVSNRRFLGTFAVPAGDTVDEQLTTPQIVKSLNGIPYWCFITYADGSTGSFYTTYSGYVVSGTFTPPTLSAPPPGKTAPSQGRAK